MKTQSELSPTYGLIGHPLGHSYSSKLFNDYFNRKGIEDEKYGNIDLPELTAASLQKILSENPRLRGFNVTAPYKEAILPFLDTLSATASRIGAVNTVAVSRGNDGKIILKGYNTDVVGFSGSVMPLLNHLAPGQGALILGTGGASKAVAEALNLNNIGYLFVSRTRYGNGTVRYTDLSRETVAEFPLIINATPAGTYPHTEEMPPFPLDMIDSRCIVHDLIYNPPMTAFMKAASERGATVKNGYEMLLLQARASYQLWNNKQHNT